MTTITLKINERTNFGKTFLAFLKTLSATEKSIALEEKSPYNPEFVKKIKRAEKQGNYIEIDTNDIWGSLGLK